MKLIIVPFIVSLSLQATAQTEAEIRQHYQSVNEQIAAAREQGYEGPLYCNETIVNRHGRSWPAVGIFQKTVHYWYDDDPNHIPAAERDPRKVLQKVEIRLKASAYTSSEEYLFMNGRLVFFYRHEGEEGQEWETRLYFNTKGVFKSLVTQNGKEMSLKELNTAEFTGEKPTITRIQKEARQYQDLFLKSM